MLVWSRNLEFRLFSHKQTRYVCHVSVCCRLLLWFSCVSQSLSPNFLASARIIPHLPELNHTVKSLPMHHTPFSLPNWEDQSTCSVFAGSVMPEVDLLVSERVSCQENYANMLSKTSPEEIKVALHFWFMSGSFTCEPPRLREAFWFQSFKTKSLNNFAVPLNAWGMQE